jgi:hypothetical protein
MKNHNVEVLCPGCGLHKGSYHDNELKDDETRTEYADALCKNCSNKLKSASGCSLIIISFIIKLYLCQII